MCPVISDLAECLNISFKIERRSGGLIIMNKKGFTGIIYLVVGLVIGVILLVGVLVPVTSTVVTNQAFTGVNATIANNLTTFILIGVLVLVAGIAMYGMARR